LRISRRVQWALFILTLAINDMVMLGMGLRLAYFIRFELPPRLAASLFNERVTPVFENYQNLTLAAGILWLVLFIWLGLYSRENLLGGPTEYALVFRATTTGILIVILANFFEVQPQPIARGWTVLAWGLAFFCISLGRFTLRRVVYYLRQHGYFISRALIVGANNEGILLANQFQSPRSSGLDIVGFVDKKFLRNTVPARGLPVLGNMESLDDIIRENNIEEIILASSSITSRDKLLEIFQRYGMADGVHVRMSSGLYEIITTGLSVKEYAYVPLVCVNKVRLTGVDNLLKTTLDYALTAPSMLFVLPLFLLISIAIKLDSPGPIFYTRRVMGQNNRQFGALKFRTMYTNGDEILQRYPDKLKELEETHKIKDDPRVTRVGALLRKWSLDELPQLFNVLARDMSLVGPRMIHPDEMREYNQWGMNLLTVKPGITGLWQVSGRSDLSYAERVRLDMHYIRNWSIWMDFQLLVQTIPAVLKSRGAY
jgi:exopolysaccharide biosynthesis polyprenyl glycosylphosphotransferase